MWDYYHWIINQGEEPDMMLDVKLDVPASAVSGSPHTRPVLGSQYFVMSSGGQMAG